MLTVDSCGLPTISEYDQPGKIKRLLRFVWACWKLNLAGAMEFRLSFLLTAGMMIVNNVVWIVFWGIYFSGSMF